jgi:hypothetical protein
VQITQLLRLAPAKRQTLLFSATMTESVQALISLSLSAPVRLAADPTASAPTTLRQEVLRIKASAEADKAAVLLALCVRSLKESRTIVFCAQKWQAHRLKVLMGLAGLPFASELHGDMTQVLVHPLVVSHVSFNPSLAWPDVRLSLAGSRSRIFSLFEPAFRHWHPTSWSSCLRAAHHSAIVVG